MLGNPYNRLATSSFRLFGIADRLVGRLWVSDGVYVYRTLCEWLKLPLGPTVHTVRITRGDHVCGWQPLMSAMDEVAKRVCPASATPSPANAPRHFLIRNTIAACVYRLPCQAWASS